MRGAGLDPQAGAGMAVGALNTQEGSASPVWSFLSNGVYGFIAPGTRTFVVVGSSGAIDSGIGYKIPPDAYSTSPSATPGRSAPTIVRR